MLLPLHSDLDDLHSSDQPELSYVLVLAGNSLEKTSPAGQENTEQIRCPLTLSLSQWSMERAPQQLFQVPSNSWKTPPWWTTAPKEASSGQSNVVRCNRQASCPLKMTPGSIQDQFIYLPVSLSLWSQVCLCSYIVATKHMVIFPNNTQIIPLILATVNELFKHSRLVGVGWRMWTLGRMA